MGQWPWDGCCGGWGGLGAREEHCKNTVGLAKTWVPSGRWRVATHREQNKNYFPGVRGLSGMKRDCLTLNLSISRKNEIHLISAFMQWGWESELLDCSSRSSNIKVLIYLLFLLIITFWSVQTLKHKACLYWTSAVLQRNPVPCLCQMLTKWGEKHFSLPSLFLGCLPSPFPNPRDSLSRNGSWMRLFPRSSRIHLEQPCWPMGCCDSALSPSPAPASISQGVPSLVWGCLALGTSSWTP